MSIVYKGIEIEGLEKNVGFYHSNLMRSMGQDSNRNADYLEKITEYKKTDLTQEQFDEINKLWSVVKMNYQICNGGIYQYFMNGYHEGWKSEDGETEIWDKETQVEMLERLCGFAGEVFPDNLVDNSKLMRITKFFESLEYEENVPQYGTVECDEDEEIWDEDLEDWVKNPDYEEPYEDIVDYENEVRTYLAGLNADDFDNEYYQINEYLEKVIELYAQYLDKCIQKEISLGVDDVIQEAKMRSDGELDSSSQVEKEFE